jgi:hypothetical protein
VRALHNKFRKAFESLGVLDNSSGPLRESPLYGLSADVKEWDYALYAGAKLLLMDELIYRLVDCSLCAVIRSFGDREVDL